ncbi:MAG: hypothetical protein M1826_004413 [Phylliscum demangeonii]|nr:MAG: hypothetical protein M1826_004413 [Phylliscum demangeonii]
MTSTTGGGDAPLAFVLPPPSSCFSPLAQTTGELNFKDISSGTTVIVLPTNTECRPEYTFWKDPCPTGYMTDESWPKPDLTAPTSLYLLHKTCCPSGYSPAQDGYTTFTTTGVTALPGSGPQSSSSTTYTAVLRTPLPSNVCLSALATPTVLKAWVASGGGGDPTGAVMITTPMTVLAVPISAPLPYSEYSNFASFNGSLVGAAVTASPSQQPASAALLPSAITPHASSASATTAPSTGSPPAPAPAPAPASASASSSNHATASFPHSAAIGMGIAIPILLLVMLAGALFFCLQRRKRQQRHQQQQDPVSEPAPSYPELANHHPAPAQIEKRYALLDSGAVVELPTAAAGHGYELQGDVVAHPPLAAAAAAAAAGGYAGGFAGGMRDQKTNFF